METNIEIESKNIGGRPSNTMDDIRTDGTIYKDTSSKGIRNGKRVFANRYIAEITIDGIRYRYRSRHKSLCTDWIKAVKMGRIKPTDNKADWWRMEQKHDKEVRYDEIIVSAAEEAMLLYDYHHTNDISNINNYVVSRLVPHLVYYCCHTLHLGQKTSTRYVLQAIGLLYQRITAGTPVPNFTATCKRMLKVRREHKDFWYYEQAPSAVKMVIDGIDLSMLAEVWKVTKDRRL